MITFGIADNITGMLNARGAWRSELVILGILDAPQRGSSIANYLSN